MISTPAPPDMLPNGLKSAGRATDDGDRTGRPGSELKLRRRAAPVILLFVLWARSAGAEPAGPIVARHDPNLRAVLAEQVQLRYSAATPGLPPHVRAASAVRSWKGGLIVIQDDVNALAFARPTGLATALLLPPGPGGLWHFEERSGTKALKMDLEAAALLPDGRLAAFGSGSTAARERLAILGPDGSVRVVDAAPLYALLRAEPAFAGSELNVEGALVRGDALWLFQRGNGAPEGLRGAAHPVNATCQLPLGAFLGWLDHGGPAPAPRDICQYELGSSSGARFGFTDAALTRDGRIAFLACAEDSPDAVRDGPVRGCRLGFLEGGRARTLDVVDGEGRPSTLKLEGLETSGKASELVAVADMDDPDRPAVCVRLRLEVAASPSAR